VRVAVVGAGIAGLAAARDLAGDHDVHLFDAAPRAGGHACTVEVDDPGGRIAVDVGFIVYNRRNYPLFSRLLDELAAPTAESSMGFSVSCPRSGFEYSGERLRGLLARPANLLDPRLWGVVRGQLRFAAAGAAELAAGRDRSVADFAAAARLPDDFLRWYLQPMAGAIWSLPPGEVPAMSARSLLAFFAQHGLLDLRDRPQWRTVSGGSRGYVERLVAALPATLHLGTPVEQVRRLRGRGVELRAGGATAVFDHVVLALHSDQALRLLAEPLPREEAALRAIRYRDNEVVLHHDTRLLPRRRAAWTSWNVRADAGAGIGVTYWMNALQPLAAAGARRNWCVTLNRGDLVDPTTVAYRTRFAHPQLDAAAVAAQSEWGAISGLGGIHYAGAWWRHGFHEDGMWSGLRAAARLRASATGAWERREPGGGALAAARVPEVLAAEERGAA
jgi:predicted NAD/FAD-binding protein